MTGLPFRSSPFPRLYRSLALAGAGLCLCAPAHAQTQQGVSPETGIGVSYITGDYGEPQTTSVIYAPLTVTLRAPNWRLEATAPFIQIHGPNNVAGADGTPVVVGDGPSRESTRAGFGDLLLGGGFYLPRSPHLPLFDVSARVKAPTAASDLGTGRADYSAQLAAYEPVSPKLLLMASAGYQWLGLPGRRSCGDDVNHARDGSRRATNTNPIHAGRSRRQCGVDRPPQPAGPAGSTRETTLTCPCTESSPARPSRRPSRPHAKSSAWASTTSTSRS